MKKTHYIGLQLVKVAQTAHRLLPGNDPGVGEIAVFLTNSEPRKKR
jgi:hypothetical protein